MPGVSQGFEVVAITADGGTAMDPEVIAQLLVRGDPVDALTAREREVLALMAEGHDNTTIAGRLVITDNAVHKHIFSDQPHREGSAYRLR